MTIARRMAFTGGLPETSCGAGSTVAYTEHLRTWLPETLRFLNVSTVVDAPCGDLNWIIHTDLSDIDYIGMDNDTEHCALAAGQEWVVESFQPRSKLIVERDILNEPWVIGDVVICRDFLQHLPFRDVMRIMNRFVESGAAWFFATSHEPFENMDIDHIGDFRPLDLTAPPFGLPSSSLSVEDCPGSGRVMRIWSRDVMCNCVGH